MGMTLKKYSCAPASRQKGVYVGVETEIHRMSAVFFTLHPTLRSEKTTKSRKIATGNRTQVRVVKVVITERM
jgi:hypothetical protein